MARSYRKERLESEIFRRVSLVIHSEVRDPRLGFVTLTRVELSPDFSLARIYVGDYEKRPGRQNVVSVLNRARKFIRARVVPELRMRRPPDFVFARDKGFDNVREVERELERLNEERGGASGSREG